MAALILLAVILIQQRLCHHRWTGLDHPLQQALTWYTQRLPALDPVIRQVLIAVPVILGVALLTHLLKAAFGFWGPGLLDAALLWYILDAYPGERTAEEALTAFFAPFFWYAVGGGPLLVLYALTRTPAYRDWLHWVPARLLGFSLALFGHYTRVISVGGWLTPSPAPLAAWEEAAGPPEARTTLLHRVAIFWWGVLVLLLLVIR